MHEGTRCTLLDPREDARVLDELVRADPEGAYTQEFYDRLREATNWRLGQLSS